MEPKEILRIVHRIEEEIGHHEWIFGLVAISAIFEETSASTLKYSMMDENLSKEVRKACEIIVEEMEGIDRMNDYISREDAIQAKCENLNPSGAYADGWNECNSMFINNLLNIPAADVVPVVRCKDCICFHPIGTSKHNGDCDKHYERVQCDDYCSWAEVGQDG